MPQSTTQRCFQSLDFMTLIFCCEMDSVAGLVLKAVEICSLFMLMVNIMIIFKTAASVNDVSSFWYRFREASALLFDGWSTRTRIKGRHASAGMLARVADCLLYAGPCPLETRNGIRCTGHAQRRSFLRSEEAKHLAQLNRKRCIEVTFRPW